MRNVTRTIVTTLAALLLGLGGASARPAAARPESGWVRDAIRAGDFVLVCGGRAADLHVSDDDFRVVRIAADDLAAEVARVTGVRPAVRTETKGLSHQAVLVGTLGVAMEGRAEALREGEEGAASPVLDPDTRGRRFIDIFNPGRASVPWVARAQENWIRLSRANGSLSMDGRLRVSVDWRKAPEGERVEGLIEIEGAGARHTMKGPVFNPAPPRPGSLKGFVESSGVVSIEAEHFTSKTDRAGAGWQVIPGLDRTGDSVAVLPEDAPSVEPRRAAREAPSVEYRMYLFNAGEFELTFYLIPTRPVRGAGGLRFAYSLDGAEPRGLAASAGVEVTSSARPRPELC